MAFKVALFSFAPVAVSQSEFPQVQFQQAQFQQAPGANFAQHGFPYFQQRAPTAVQYQQPASDFAQYQEAPDFTPYLQQAPDLTQFSQFDFQPISGQSPEMCGAAAEAGSECCKVQKEQNPLSHGSQLSPGNIYCAQAADTRWWNVKVVKQNCDGSYAVEVQDDARSEWPVTQRAMILDQSCDDFYSQALRDAGVEAQPKPAAGKKEPTKEEYRASFIPVDARGWSYWLGEYIDLFSPDDKNPASRRFIDFDDSQLIVSADTGTEKWGRRFDPKTEVMPVLEETEEPSKRKCSFRTKIPKDAPVYADVEAGALDFTLTLGTSMGHTVIMWTGMYDGKGGKFGGDDVPAEECGNFWRLVEKVAPSPPADGRGPSAPITPAQSAKKTPWKAISAAAALGSMPLVFSAGWA